MRHGVATVTAGSRPVREAGRLLSAALIVTTALVLAGCASGGRATSTSSPGADPNRPTASAPSPSTSEEVTDAATDTEAGGDRPPSPTSLALLTGLAYEEIATVDFPSILTALPGEDSALLGLRSGVVSTLGGTTVLDISANISLAGEGGLLGLAIHPAGDRLYVHYTDRVGDTVVSEFSFDGTTADQGSERMLLNVEQPASNHNGGMIQFGPDGALYLGLGDGGASGDQFGNGQNTGTLLGGLVRIDVASSEFRLWQYGLRNPWRFWIDGDDIWIADVGQGAFEEVDLASIAAEGTNYGWPITEGLSCYEASDCDTQGITQPLIDIGHDDAGTCSITGGVVYRGTAIPELDGRFLFSDFCGGYLRSVARDGDVTDHTDDVGVPGQVVSFGVDGAGEVYVLTDSSVLKIVPVR